MKNTKPFFFFFGIALLCMVLLSSKCKKTTKETFYETTGYSPFITKGYGPGSIISINGNDVKEEIPRYWLLKNVFETEPLDTEIDTSTVTFDKYFTDEFKAGLDLKVTLEKIEPSLLSAFKNITNIRLKADDTYATNLKNGGMSLGEVLSNLPYSKLLQLKDALNSNRKLLFITETLTIKSGTQSYSFKTEFNDTLKASIKAKLTTLLDGTQTIDWKRNDSLVLNFKNTIVGYKCDTLTEERIDRVLEECIKNGCNLERKPTFINEKFTYSTNFRFSPENTYWCNPGSNCDGTEQILNGTLKIYADIGGTGNSEININSIPDLNSPTFKQILTIKERVFLQGGGHDVGQEYMGNIRKYNSSFNIPNTKSKWLLNIDISCVGGDNQPLTIIITGNDGINKTFTSNRTNHSIINFVMDVKPGDYNIQFDIGSFKWGNFSNSNQIELSTIANINIQ